MRSQAEKYSPWGGVQQFYKKKLLTVVLPLVVYSAFYIIDERIAAGTSMFSIAVLSDFLVRLSANKVSFHLWFVYSLLGSLLAAPILKYAFENMTKKTRNLIFVLASVVMQVQILLSNINVGFSVGFVITGWLYVFCIGWYVEITVSQGNERWLYMAGIIGYVLTVLAICFLPVYKNATDWALPHIVFSAAVFVLFRRRVHIANETMEKIISFVSKYTFSVYLIHVIVIRRLPAEFLPVNTGNAIANHIVGSLRIFVVSFVAAIVIDSLIINPLKYLTHKAIIKPELESGQG